MTGFEDGGFPSRGSGTDLARLLRAARERRGLSQARAAAVAGVQPQTVSRLEGDGANAQLATLRRYVGGLGYVLELAVRDGATGEVAGRIVLPAAEGDDALP